MWPLRFTQQCNVKIQMGKKNAARAARPETGGSRERERWETSSLEDVLILGLTYNRPPEDGKYANIFASLRVVCVCVCV